MKYLTKNNQYKTIPVAANLALLFFALAFSSVAMSQGMAGTDTKISGFFTNIVSLLNLASIAVVTIAVIFAGYQIAFANKRIADVAPILVGGVLIGAATQIAKMLIPEAATSA
ncbi:MAG: TrbC/VirB2 family protein [Arenimonas sp.]